MMKRTTRQTIYEWAVETTDEHGDIIDICFWDTFKECQAMMKRTTRQTAVETTDEHGVALMYSKYLEDDMVERGYAYLEDGKLPERFDTGKNVPKRFHKEVR